MFSEVAIFFAFATETLAGLLTEVCEPPLSIRVASLCRERPSDQHASGPARSPLTYAPNHNLPYFGVINIVLISKSIKTI
jgi:hypothetical protein